MATSNILRISDINFDEVTFSTPKSLDNGGKMIALYHKGKPLIMQTPNMDAPYGLSRFPSDKGGDDKVSLDVSFKAGNQEFLEFMKKLDQKIVDEAFANGMPWFKKKFNTRDVVEALYTPLVKLYKDKETGEASDKYPPTFKMAIPLKDGKYGVEVYDNNREKIDMADIELRNAAVTSIIQCNGVWVAGGKFGCKFKAVQMKVSQKSSKISGYAFLDDEDRIVDA
jgi:hypothetical protein